MNKIEHDWGSLSNIGLGDNYHNLPIQTISAKKKTPQWGKACMDALEGIGLVQIRQNIRLRDYRKMMEGQFTYAAVGIEEMELPWFQEKVVSLRAEQNIPTYLKHFDIIGIVVNALTGIYSEFEDRFVVDSRDEYSTNEYIRQKTEMLHQYAQAVFKQEINKLLLMRGIDPQKNDFKSEEEQQAYQQQLQQEVQALTPPEIERFLSKNFKVIATEWAQNVIENDKKRFRIPDMDKESFIDYLLSGRYFKHFHVGYDFYSIEHWKIEETFFSQDVDCKFPQDGEFAGRIRNMSPSTIINRYGHLMTTKQQEAVGNYWNQSMNFESYNGVRNDNPGTTYKDAIFGQDTVIPFHNYYDHQVNVQLENALGVPLGRTTLQDGEGNTKEVASWIPRHQNDAGYGTDLYSTYLRDDVAVRRDTVRVVEAYWRSYKRLGVLIFENDLGSTSIELTTDDLLPEFLKEEEIKKLKNISLQELQTALKEERLEEYVGTITYIYVPEVWKGIKIRGNGSTVKEDIYLDVRPLDYQIKGGDSNMYDVKLPVAGIIDTGIAIKLQPFQQLYNICMNQITELLEKELGVFFTFDITGLPSEYQDETTEESIYRARDIIKDTGLLALDLSRQNTQGNNPNVFNRQEVVFATQVQYRWQLAQQYKQEALSQIGITPQILGQPNTYMTSEGVKQGAQASYALIDTIFDKMNHAKAKEIELHISIAQYCQSNGKDQSVLFRGSDGDHAFLDIMAEDGELFPLRFLGVTPSDSSKDRRVVEQVKQFIMQDNTITKDLKDTIDILTNPTIIELKEIAENAQKRTETQTQQQRQFEQQQQQQAFDAQAKQNQEEFAHEKELEEVKGFYKLEQQRIATLKEDTSFADLTIKLNESLEKTNQHSIDNNFRQQEIGIKQQEADRKQNESENSMAERIKTLEIKQQELALKRKAIDTSKFNSIINKN